jgi:hypothetical protein
MLNVPVVMLVAAVAVLAGVIAVAVGRGGELTFFQADYAPLKLGEMAATDVVLFRPPMALWGYNVQATDEALNRIAEALTERDIEITALRQQVANLEASSPAGRRRARPGSNDRPDVPGRPASGLPADSPDERSSGPLPRAGPPPGAAGPGPGTRSSGPLPRVGAPPGAAGPDPGSRSSGPLPRVGPPLGGPGPGSRSSGPLPRVGAPPGAAGPGSRDARTPGAGNDRAAWPATPAARDAERFGLGGSAPPGHQPPPAGTDPPAAPAQGDDDR